MFKNPEEITYNQIFGKKEELSKRRADIINRISGMQNEQILRSIADAFGVTKNTEASELQKELIQHALEQSTEDDVGILENKIKLAIENFKNNK